LDITYVNNFQTISIANATGYVTRSVAQATNFIQTHHKLQYRLLLLLLYCQMQYPNQKQNHLIQTQHFISSPDRTTLPSCSQITEKENLIIQSKKMSSSSYKQNFPICIHIIKNIPLYHY